MAIVIHRGLYFKLDMNDVCNYYKTFNKENLSYFNIFFLFLAGPYLI